MIRVIGTLSRLLAVSLALAAACSTGRCCAERLAEAQAVEAEGTPASSALPPSRYYVVDVGHGNAVFVVAPSGEVMLLDAGPTRAAGRILAFMQQNGIRKVDYAVVSHFDDDHFGAVPAIAKKFPLGCILDHGESVSYAKGDEWWRPRRGQSFRPGMGKEYDQAYDLYRAARAKTRHVILQPGDGVPLAGLDVKVVCAAGKVLAEPLPGAGMPNTYCKDAERRAEDDGEDGQLIGVLVRHGKFRFIDLGDVTWNTENALFCPRNLIGTVDAYVVTHHARGMPREMGEYQYALSSCPPGEVLGLQPRVAILTMGAAGHRGGTPDAMKLVKSVPGLDLWQTELVREGGEKDDNAPEQFIATVGKPSDKAPFIQITALPDGSFTVTNSRNGFSKRYPIRPQPIRAEQGPRCPARHSRT